MINTFKQAEEYLLTLVPLTRELKFPKKRGLKRMKALCDMFDNPERKFKTIHIAGTSGKGSTATFLASILAQKFKTGLFTSPHLLDVRERVKILSNNPTSLRFTSQLRGAGKELSFAPINIGATEGQALRIGGQANNKRQITINSEQKTKGYTEFLNRYEKWSESNIPENEFIDLLNLIRPAIDDFQYKKEIGKPTYFEVITLLGFLYFAKQKIQWAVIEAGLGGKYDGTNIIIPEICILTNIGLDHTQILGNTVEKIALDKAGIIKNKCHVVAGVRQSSVIEIIENRCLKFNVNQYFLNDNFSYEIKDAAKNYCTFNYQGKNKIENLKINLAGIHQVGNAVLATKAAEEIEEINTDDIKKGLIDSYIPARLDCISTSPEIIIDGAHNGDKMKALGEYLNHYYSDKKANIILSIKNDKDIEGMLSQINFPVNKIILTSFSQNTDLGLIQSYSLEMIKDSAEKVLPGINVLIRDNLKKAFEEMLNQTSNKQYILITGSLYLCGEAIKYIINYK